MREYYDEDLGITFSILPCGARAIREEQGTCGLRCQECNAIWGSVACECSEEGA